MKIYSPPKSNWKLFCVIYYLKFNIIMLITRSPCFRGPFRNVIMCRLYLKVTIFAFHLFNGLNVGAGVELSRLTTKTHSWRKKKGLCKTVLGLRGRKNIFIRSEKSSAMADSGDWYWACKWQIYFLGQGEDGSFHALKAWLQIPKVSQALTAEKFGELGKEP